MFHSIALSSPPKTTTDAANNNAPLFTNKETKKIVSIATHLIQKAKADGKTYQVTHKKNIHLFQGRKFHSLVQPNGTFIIFVKNAKDPSKELEQGTFKDMDSSSRYQVAQDKTIIELPKTARVRFKDTSQESAAYAKEEIDYHVTLNGHPNIVKLINFMTYEKIVGTQKITKNILYLDLHQMNLDQFLDSPSFLDTKGVARINLILSIFQQQLKAIQYMHEKGIVHNDIKLRNFLVTVNAGASNPHVVATDFGLSVSKKKIDQIEYLGSYPYLSPEMCLKQKIVSNSDKLAIQPIITHKIDLWALGISLFLMKNDNDVYPITSRYIFLLSKISSKFISLPEIDAEKSVSENSIPQITENLDPIVKTLNRILDELGIHTCTLTSSVDKLTMVSPCLKKLEPTDPDSTTLANLKKVQMTFDLLINEIIINSSNHPEVLQHPAYTQVSKEVSATYKMVLKSVDKMLRFYLETIPSAKVPSKTEDPVDYLIQMLLQPNSSKRIDTQEALQVIEEFQRHQTVCAETSSSINTKKRSFDETVDSDQTKKE
jgi:serine/threonine protein kinase